MARFQAGCRAKVICQAVKEAARARIPEPVWKN